MSILEFIKNAQRVRIKFIGKLLLLTAIIFLAGLGCYYEKKDAIFSKKKLHPSVAIPAGKKAFSATYIHYNINYCLECHEKIPAAGGDNFLKFGGNFRQLCRCHYEVKGNYIHPVNVAPSDELKLRIPEKFPLRHGKITCNTCHDIYIQCQEDKKLFQKENMFLRKLTSESNTSFCVECHDQTRFKKYNPHRQLDQNGIIVKVKCLYCHSVIPDVIKSEYKDVKLIGNLEALCMRCHHKLNQQSLHDSHLRIPSLKILARIKQIQGQYNVVLPLTEEGKITCATCHNPHEKGIIPVERPGAKGASAHLRQRIPGNMCIQCHQF